MEIAEDFLHCGDVSFTGLLVCSEARLTDATHTMTTTRLPGGPGVTNIHLVHGSTIKTCSILPLNDVLLGLGGVIRP